MGFYKLREWVGTVTGKGDRWGGDRVGRSEPAFLSASTLALPPSTCTAWREAGQHHLRLLFCCEAGQLLAVLLRGLCRADCLPAVFACSGLVLQAVFACLLAFAMPCPLPFSSVCPRSVLLCPLFISMCARIVELQQFASCKNCPVGSCNTGLQWRPVRRFTI